MHFMKKTKQNKTKTNVSFHIRKYSEFNEIFDFHLHL